MKKKLFIAPLLIALFGVVAAPVVASLPTIMTLAENEEVKFDDVYYTNEEIVIPDYSIDVDGQKVNATKYIVYPNGRTYQKESFTPIEMGYYTISYRANGAQKDYRIYVAKKKYYVTGEGDASWKAHQKTPSKESLVVTLAAGSVFHFDEIIDLKELGTDKSIFSFYPVTSEPGATDANTLKIRLTDVYDETRYVQFEIDASRQGYSHGIVYMRVGGDNQTPTGVEEALGRIHVGSIFGFPYHCNFYCCTKTMGTLTEREYISNRIGLFFDYKNMMGLSLTNESGQSMICDLDDSDYFSEFWEGMTTGECKVSAWFENMMAPTATICVTNIGEKDLENQTLRDEIKPSLVVEDIFDNMPDAIVNQKYRFYHAIGKDQYSGEVGAKIRVYRDYYNTKINVPTLEDGFIPTKLGTYYIEYSCIDYSLNEIKKVYEIKCVNEERDFNLSLVNGYSNTGYVGEIIKLADIEINGAIGPAIAKNYVVTPDNEMVDVDKTFTPLTKGTYQVKYEVIDFIGTIKSVSYNLTVTISDAPIINEEAILLPYYLAGYEYELPTINAIDFNKDNNPEVVSKIKIIDGGKETTLDSNKVTFETSSQYNRDVTIRYICENEKASNTKDYHVQVVTTSTDGFIHMDKYWYGKGANATALSNEINITSSQSGSATFVNNLAANEFEINFVLRSSSNNFKALNFYLVDSVNQEEKVKISYHPASEKPEIYINDDTDFRYEGNGLFNDGNQFIKYDNSSHKIHTNNDVTIPVKKYVNGLKFNGFSSGSVYLTIEFVNPSNNNVAISIIDLNGQEMSNTKYDYIRPRAVMDDDYGGAKNLNDIVELCSATAYDVLDPCPKISLSVYSEDNQYIKDVNGKELKDVNCDVANLFKADKYGLYRVSYHITDYDDNSAYFTYVITVYDKIAPVISLTENNVSTAKVGETIKIAKVSVSDNLSAAENIKLTIFMIQPNGQIVEVKNNQYTFTMVGKHIIRYFALDEASNISIVDSYVEVSEVK